MVRQVREKGPSPEVGIDNALTRSIAADGQHWKQVWVGETEQGKSNL